CRFNICIRRRAALFRRPDYTRTRLKQLTERMRGRIYSHQIAVESIEVSEAVDRISFQEATQLTYRPVKLGEQFGPLWSTFWFKARVTVPVEWAGERVDLLWVSHSEATLWIDGRSIQGLNTSPDGARPDALLLDPAAGGERLDLRIELACNGMFGRLPRPYDSLEPVVLDRCQ